MHRSMQPTQLDAFWSFLVSIIAIGAIIGSLIAGRLAERYGPRSSLILNAFVNIIAALCEGCAKFARSPELLIIGRIIIGANIGIASALVPYVE